MVSFFVLRRHFCCLSGVDSTKLEWLSQQQYYRLFQKISMTHVADISLIIAEMLPNSELGK